MTKENLYNEIIEELKNAHKDVLHNTHLQFTVYLDKCGKPYTFTDLAGGNSQPIEAYE